MRLELVPRPHVPGWARLAAPLLAIVVALAAAGLAVALFGRSPLAAFDVYLVQPLSQAWGLQEVLLKATPLILISVGLTFCFRAGLWNIGAEGQFIAGALLAAWLALGVGANASPWLMPIVLALGVIGGALWAAVPALLRARLGVSEILTSLMFVYVAELLLDYLVRGPWRDPRGFNFPQTAVIADSLRLPPLFADGRLHIGVVIALVVAALAAFVLARTRLGFALTVSGLAPRAALFAGFRPAGLTLGAFAVSGGLAGLAGAIEVVGQIGQLKPNISPGYGFTAIAVAFLGRLHPLGCVLASLLLSLVAIGAENAQIFLRLPLDLARVFQGALLLAVLAADALTTHRVRLVRSPRLAGA